MKSRTLTVVALLLCMLCAFAGCKAAPETDAYTDSLPASSKSGRKWMVYVLMDSTGDVAISQSTAENDAYAMLGADSRTEHLIVGTEPGQVNIRMYYVDPAEWTGFRSDAYGVAYYELLIDDDLSIRLLYSEVELPEEY